MPQELIDRIERLETRIVTLERNMIVLNTAVSLARWFGPFAVSIIAIAFVLIKG